MKSKMVLYPDFIEYRLPNGILHREDGPAREWNDGDKFWFFKGKHHRIDGPAFDSIAKNNHWSLNDTRILMIQEYKTLLLLTNYMRRKHAA